MSQILTFTLGNPGGLEVELAVSDLEISEAYSLDGLLAALIHRAEDVGVSVSDDARELIREAIYERADYLGLIR